MTISISKKSNTSILLHAIISIVVVLIFGFFDEGAYNLNSLKQPAMWLLVLVYSFIILSGQAITSVFILRNYQGKHKTLLTVVIGVLIGLGMLYAIFYSLG